MKLKLTFQQMMIFIFLSSLIACAKSQDRIPITNRAGIKNPISQSKVFAAENITALCSDNTNESDSKDKTSNKKEILSLAGLKESLSSDEAKGSYAVQYIQSFEIYLPQSQHPHQGALLNNTSLLKSYILERGLLFKGGNLNKLIQELLSNVTSEDCNIVTFSGSDSDLIIALANGSVFERISSISQIQSDIEEDVPTDNNEEDSAVEKISTTSVEYSIDKDYSNVHQLSLKAKSNNNRIIFKLLDSETIEVVTEENLSRDICGKSIDHTLRQEMRITWGSKIDNPVTINNSLFEGMKDLAKNSKLLTNNSIEMKSKNSRTSSTKVSLQIIKAYDESLIRFQNGEENDFKIAEPACSGEGQ